MAISKKGSRKIVVDNITYRWTIRSKPTYSQGAFEDNMTAAAELYDNPGTVLSITFPWVRCDNWIENPKVPVTPKDIEKSIRGALKKGWKPENRGSAFKYTHEAKP